MEIKYTNAFAKGLKLLNKQGNKKAIRELETVVPKLQNGEKLDAKYRDHKLHANNFVKENSRCAHLLNDVLLVYTNDNGILSLEQIGDHHTLRGFGEGLEESENTASKEEVLADMDKTFGQEGVYMWSTYILPNGHFLNPENPNAEWYWEEQGITPDYEHCDFIYYEYNPYGEYLFDDCIKMNVTYPYLILPATEKWTAQQQNAVKEIIRNKSNFVYEIEDVAEKAYYNNASVNVYEMSEPLLIDGPFGTTVLDLSVYDEYDVIKIINKAYMRGYIESDNIDEAYEPVKKGIAYKVFRVKDGKLYPPMVANSGGKDTPIGVWVDAEAGEFAGLSKTGRPQVKQAKGGATLSYRPGWHLGDVPRAKQFDRINKKTGEPEFPKDFVWAECEYAMDVDYQPESDARGYERTKIGDDGKVITYKSDKYQHSLAGIPHIPEKGYYKYRTNPNPDTVSWVITGSMKVNKLLSDEEVNNILKSKGIEPIHRQGGDKTLAELGLSESLKEDFSNKLYHTSNPIFREKIAKEGLTPQVGDSYYLHYSEYRPDDIRPCIFLSKEPYDSTYDDDIYEVNLSSLDKEQLESDPEFKDGYRYFKSISTEDIKLIYKGECTMKCEDLKEAHRDDKEVVKLRKTIKNAKKKLNDLGISTVNENIGDKKITYKGYNIDHFVYTLNLVDKEVGPIDGYIILSNTKIGDDLYLPLYCENEEGEVLDFKTLDEAKDWIDKYDGKYTIEIKHRDEIHAVINEAEDLDESVEKHDTLNPALWNEDNTLKEDVSNKILQIADDFLDDLEEDEIKINVVDIKLVGSNCSYNYNPNSDLDVHIVADTDSLNCPDNLYPLLYSAYRSIWNSKYDPVIHGVPVELYVETSDTEQLSDETEETEEEPLEEARKSSALVSNGIYSVLHDTWIKEPVQADIPDIDTEVFEKLFKEWEDKYFDVVAEPTFENIKRYIEDIYDLRKSSIASDGEYGIGNLVFKECRNLGYLDNLKNLRNQLKTKELSLEDLSEEDLKENFGKGLPYVIERFDKLCEVYKDK